MEIKNDLESAKDMNIEKKKLSNKLIVALSGRLDTTTSPKLQESLIPEFDNETHIELDFKDLKYLSSAGLRVLLIATKTAKAKNGRLTLINVSDDINEVFQMTGFSDILNIES